MSVGCCDLGWVAVGVSCDACDVVEVVGNGDEVVVFVVGECFKSVACVQVYGF